MGLGGSKRATDYRHLSKWLSPVVRLERIRLAARNLHCRNIKRRGADRAAERGRALLRLLSVVAIAINACNEFAEATPIHCSGTIAEIARKNARAWQEVAEKFDV
jgi:hypothetical protein